MMTAEEREILRDLKELWPERRIVLVGATALGFYVEMRWRKTADIDLAVALDIDEFPAGVDELKGWERDSKKEHRFFSRGYMVDVLPVGTSTLSSRRLVWPNSGFEMSMVGFDLAFDCSEQHSLGSAMTVDVAPPPVITILKMVAYLDCPDQRERDLADLGYLFEDYLDAEDERRFCETVIDAGLDFDVVNAYFLGSDVGEIAQPEHGEVVSRFLALLSDTEERAYLQMVRSGPYSAQDERGLLRRRLEAFRVGFDQHS